MTRYQEALAGYEAALVIEPDYIPSLSGRSLSLARLDRSEEAIQATTDILEVDPNNLWALEKRAVMLASAEQFELAIADTERYIRINPNRSTAHAALAIYLAKIGEIDAAVEAWDRAIELNPENVNYQFGRITTWMLVENYEQMAADAEEAYARFPHNDRVLELLFKSYLRTGQDALAEEHFNIWVRRQPFFLEHLRVVENLWGQNHPMASVDTQLHLYRGILFAKPPLQRTDLAKTAFESYFEAGGPDSVRLFKRQLARLGLYRGDFNGIYDDRTSTALSACLNNADVCLEEWWDTTAL